jgi:hypothetical protein
MRKFCFLLLALSLPILFPTSLYAWDMCKMSSENLDAAGKVTYTSSFCNCADGDVITIGFWSPYPEVTLDSVVFAGATPNWVNNKSWAKQSGIAPYSATVVLHKVTENTNTIYLWVYLSTGEYIGISAHFEAVKSRKRHS